MFNQDIYNEFKAEIEKLVGKPGLIHLQNDVDYRVIVQQYTGFEVTEHYDDESDPMIFKVSFINEAGREDALEIWDTAITALDFEQPDAGEEGMGAELQFSFAAVKDESNAVEFYRI
jgi:hypothetical protein